MRTTSYPLSAPGNLEEFLNCFFRYASEVGADNRRCSARCRCFDERWRGWRSCRAFDAASCSRWKDIDEQARLLTVREAVYDGVFSTPKTEAGARQIPLSESALTLIAEWKAHVEDVKPDALMFSTSAGTPILPNNVVRRFIFPACKRLGLPLSTWLTFRRTYSSWSHDRGVPGKVVAQLMGHANVDTTLNVYTQVLDGSLREAVDKVGGGLFTIVHKRGRRGQGTAA